MIASTFLLVFKIVAVVAILAAMVMLLVGVRHITAVSSDKEDADLLRKEVDSDDRVVTPNSLFHQFLSSPEIDSRTRKFVNHRGRH